MIASLPGRVVTDEQETPRTFAVYGSPLRPGWRDGATDEPERAATYGAALGAPAGAGV